VYRFTSAERRVSCRDFSHFPGLKTSQGRSANTIRARHDAEVVSASGKLWAKRWLESCGKVASLCSAANIQEAVHGCLSSRQNPSLRLKDEVAGSAQAYHIDVPS